MVGLSRSRCQMILIFKISKQITTLQSIVGWSSWPQAHKITVWCATSCQDRRQSCRTANSWTASTWIFIFRMSSSCWPAAPSRSRLSMCARIHPVCTGRTGVCIWRRILRMERRWLRLRQISWVWRVWVLGRPRSRLSPSYRVRLLASLHNL